MTNLDTHSDRTRAARRAPTVLAIVAAGAAALVTGFVAPAPAFAHSFVVDSTPGGAGTDEPGSVASLPGTVTVTFSDDLTVPLPADQQQGDESNTQIRVYDDTCAAAEDPGADLETADCHDYAVGEATVDGPTLSQHLDIAGAPAGTYTVVWQAVYGDGHGDAGSFTFVADSAVAEDTAPEDTAPDDTAPAATETPTVTETPAAPAPTADAGGADQAAGDSGLSTPALIAIVGGAVVLALIVFLVVMIARSRRSMPDER